MSRGLVPPIKWHGGKHYLAPRIVGLMPPRCKNPNAPDPADPGWLHYVEPYFGGGAVLLANDPTGISEVVNDRSGELMTFWSVLRLPDLFNEFLRKCQATEFGELIFRSSLDHPFDPEQISIDPVSEAFWFFVRCRQSLAGRMDSFAPLTRQRTRRGMNEQASAWLNAIDGLPAVHARLRGVVVLHRPALDVIRSEDGPRTLFYLDPPYLHETRATTGEYGDHEMTWTNHNVLLAQLGRHTKGRFLLSGYRSDLYDTAAKQYGWHRTDFDLPNNAAGGSAKRRMTESVWSNYRPEGKGRG